MSVQNSSDDNGLCSKLEFSSDSLEQRIAQNLQNSLELRKYVIWVLVLSLFSDFQVSPHFHDVSRSVIGVLEDIQ